MSPASTVDKLQLLQQNLQNILLQKQQIESSLLELNSACEEVAKTDKAYKIVGKIMLAASPTDILSDLQQKKETAEIRLKSFLRQEENIKKTMQSIQQDAVKELQDKR